MIILTKGITSQRLQIFIQDNASTTGAGKTGLAFNTAGLTWYYLKDGDAADTQITLATATVGTWATGGFKEIDATNMPGWYEIGIPNAAMTGANLITHHLRGASGMVDKPITIQLSTLDLTNATVAANVTTWSGTAVATPDTVGYPKVTIKDGTGTGELDTNAGTVTLTDGSLTAAKIGADAITAAKIAADVTTEVQAGLATAAAVAAIQADTDDIQTRLPAALIAGRIDASVGAIAANVITATAIATDAITAAKIAADAIGASELAADGIAEIQSGLATSAGIVSIQADTDDIQSRLPAALVSGRMASDAVAISGSTATADAVETNIANLDVAVSTRLATAGYTAPDNADIVAIRTRTDNLPSDPADASDIAGAFGTVNSTLATIAGYVDTEVAAIKAKTDNLPASFPANFGILDIDGAGAVTTSNPGSAPTVGQIVDGVWDEARAGHVIAGTFGDGVIVDTNNDKAGYALTQAFPANFSILDIDGSGQVIASNAGSGGPTASDIANAVWAEPTTGHSGVGTFGAAVQDRTNCTLTGAERINIAKSVLVQNINAVEPSVISNCLARTIAMALNVKALAGGKVTVMKADGTTKYFEQPVTQTAGVSPVTATGAAV